MIMVGIDVAKDKHDCFIQTAEGKVLHKAFSFANNYEGFEELYAKILSCNDDVVRVGLESTGHYSYNLLGFLLSKELPTFVFNPLQTNQFRKSLSLRKTKTDKVDARTIALMLATESNDNGYSLQAYQNEELKSLTRYRFDKVNQRSKLKQSLSRLVTLLFPELESVVSSLHSSSIYAMLLKYPSAKDVAKSQLHSLINLLESTSRGRIGADKAKNIRSLAKKSVGIYVSAKVLELRHTIKLIQILDEEIAEIEQQIQSHMQELHSPLESIPGINFRLAAVIEAEVCDFQRFSSPDKILAFAGLSPSTYQVNSLRKMPIWKSVAHDIYVMLFYLPLTLSANIQRLLPLTCRKSAMKVNIILSLFRMLLKNLFVSFFIFKEPANLFQILLDSL